MDYSELVPESSRNMYHWLGTAPPEWFTMTRLSNLEFRVRVYPPALLNHGSPPRELMAVLAKATNGLDYVELMYAEAASRLVTDGPKAFMPSEAEWEAMANVSIDIPLDQMRSPFPVMLVAIPDGARHRLAKLAKVPVAKFPHMVLVRHREQDGVPYLLFVSNFGDHAMYNVMYGGTDSSVEEAIMLKNTGHPSSEDEYQAAIAINRAAANACLLLTMYGHTIPPLPTGRNREDTRLLRRNTVRRVTFAQQVVLRGSRYGASEAADTGIEVSTHWRRGHFRAMPGYGEARSRGEKVPLVFVKPCIVRPDRGEVPKEVTICTPHA